MNTAFFIASRVAFKRQKSFSRLIIRIAIIAIALSMTIMLIATSMVKGFQREISQKVFGFWGHIQITNYDRNSSYENSPISIEQDFLAILDSSFGIRHLQSYATKPGIIKVNDAIEGIIIKGIGQDFDWTFLEKNLISGNRLTYNPDSVSFDILISSITAGRIGISTNENMLINFIDPETLRIRSRKLNVAGIYNSGMEEYDKLVAFADIRLISRLYNWEPGQVGGFELFIHDLGELDSITKKVNELIGQDLFAQNIKQLRPSIFDWLDLQSINERVILILMTIVAVINMITALLILILERTNMVGILKAIGGSNWFIRRIFLYQALYIVSAGLFWGNFFGLGIVFLQKIFGVIRLPEETYYVSVAPVDINLWVILLMNIATLLICMFALILPSYLVSRIQPVKAIKFK